jgi:hypothetical protein
MISDHVKTWRRSNDITTTKMPKAITRQRQSAHTTFAQSLMMLILFKVQHVLGYKKDKEWVIFWLVDGGKNP